MKRLFVFAVLLVVAGGSAFLATRTIAPQVHPVEKVLPNETFLK